MQKTCIFWIFYIMIFINSGVNRKIKNNTYQLIPSCIKIMWFAFMLYQYSSFKRKSAKWIILMPLMLPVASSSRVIIYF